MKHSMEIAFKTDEGCVRELNEDTVQAGLLDGSFANPWLFDAYIVVADGMGGHDGGEVASRLAVDMVEQIFASDQVPPHTLEEVSGQDLLHRLYRAVQEINRVVHNNGQGEGTARAGTTLTLCLVRRHEYCVAHVGDSRAYLVRADSIEQVTADDSWVAEAVARGLMTEEEARHSEFRNRITKAIGLQEDIEPSVYYGQWQAGDVLLVCSDGLSEYIPAPELLELTRRCSSLEQLCHECIRLSRERGGHDNISIAVVVNCVPGTSGAGAAGQGGALSTPRRPVTWPPAGGAIVDGHDALYSHKPHRSAPTPGSSISWNWRQIKLLALGVLLLLAFLLAGLWMGRRSAQVKNKTQGRTVSQEFRLRNLPPLNASGRASDSRQETERRPVRQNPRRENPREEPVATTTAPNSARENRRREEGRRGGRPGWENSSRHREESSGTLPAPARPPDKSKPKPKPPVLIDDRSGEGKSGAGKTDTRASGKSAGGGSDAASITVGADKPSSSASPPNTLAEREDKDNSLGGGGVAKPVEPAAISKPSPEKNGELAG